MQPSSVSALVAQRRAALAQRMPVWQRLTMGDWFDRLAAEFAEREHIYTPEKSYTYAQSRQLVDRLAKSLMALGVQRREHVSMLFPTVPELAFLQLAVAKIGCVSVPLNERMGAVDLAYQVKQSDSVCLIAMDHCEDRHYIEKLQHMLPEMQGTPGAWRAESFPRLRHVLVQSPSGARYGGALDWESFLRLGEGISDEALAERQKASRYPDEVALICYTSGTTGSPKGVMLTHDMLMRSAYGTVWNECYVDGDRLASALPLHHIFAYVACFLSVLFVGGAYIPQTLFDPGKFLELLARSKATRMASVPTMAVALLNHPDLRKHDLGSLRAMINAAAATPLWVWEALQRELGIQELFTAWGMTEVSAAAMYTPFGAPLELICTAVGKDKPGGASGEEEFGGLQAQFKLIDPSTKEDLPPDVHEGELAVRGNIVTRGYYKKPMETGDAIDKDGWLRTGDIFRRRDDGYFEITGRAKDLYKIGGESVAPKEVEEIIGQHETINQVYICGVPDERMGEVGAAFIQFKSGASSSEEELTAFVQERVARFKVPKYWMFVEEFPMTASGKIQKFILRKIATEHFGLGDNAGSGSRRR
ncbi:AMP-binding protein [Extensimonas sp. H3M7-6]|uniref:AMP-binding protein n=1 Tax=Extensimonas soli TaxID=3031322 RepID=UPI0023DC84AB|nr:AMP-binding protein [Extensimonas sp. H3M7-6]MDF1481405.1 AMP-binding protein [Extensimonas sp. H3M7-6]